MDVSGLEPLRKDYCQRVAAITYLPIYVKAVALTLAFNSLPLTTVITVIARFFAAHPPFSSAC